MIGSMRRWKTISTATLYHFVNNKSKRFIITRSDTLYPVFNKMRTDIIRKNKCHKKEQTPDEALLIKG